MRAATLLLLCAARTAPFTARRARLPTSVARAPTATLEMRVTKRSHKKITFKNTGGTVGANVKRRDESEVPNKVFFANVKYEVTEEDLRPFFSTVGPVTHVQLVRDSFTGQSKGYGFCTYSSVLAATTAIRSLHLKPFMGREIRVDDATSLSKRRKEKKATEGFERREARRQAEKAAAAEGG